MAKYLVNIFRLFGPKQHIRPAGDPVMGWFYLTLTPNMEAPECTL
jgi:hypothetical protein